MGLTGEGVEAVAASSGVAVCNTEIGHRGQLGELLVALSVAGDQLAVSVVLIWWATQ